MPVVARLYAAGKLGTPTAFKARFFADVPRSDYLDASGGLRPFTALAGQARADAERMIFGHLMVSPSPFAGQIQAAYNRARKNASC